MLTALIAQAQMNTKRKHFPPSSSEKSFTIPWAGKRNNIRLESHQGQEKNCPNPFQHVHFSF